MKVIDDEGFGDDVDFCVDQNVATDYDFLIWTFDLDLCFESVSTFCCVSVIDCEILTVNEFFGCAGVLLVFHWIPLESLLDRPRVYYSQSL